MNTNIQMLLRMSHAAALAIAGWILVGASASAADLSGCWEGCWKSCGTGHQGKLRASICKIDDATYSARFSGTFFKIVPFNYTTTLHAVDNGDSVSLSGASYLGRIMGSFCYGGTADDCHFLMNYSAKKDNGVFQMTRVK